MKKNLVIGSGKGYSWYTFEPFVRSFVKNVHSADLVLFVDELTDFTVSQLEKVGKEIQGGELKLVPFVTKHMTRYLVNNRWQIFLDYLEKHDSKYDRVLTCDTRDVVFQKNIFDYFSDQKNFFAYTTEADDIKGSKTGVDLNYTWIEKCFGKDEADRLADKDIICGGTVLASVDEMKIFMKTMVECLPDHVDFHGVDQVVYQHIIYNKLLPIDNIIKIDCWTGAIFTAYIFHEYNPVKTKGDLILLGDGEIPAVVHQYDRNEELTEMVDKVYRDYNYKFDEKSADIKIEIEKLSYLVRNADLKNTLDFFMDRFSDTTEIFEYGLDFIDCWKILLGRDISDFYGEMLNVYFQKSIIKIFENVLLISHGIKISDCLKLCEKNNCTVMSEFRNWFKEKVIKAVKWHISHNNAPRYPGCIRLMIEMDLTRNEYFCFLMAELFRTLGDIEQSAGFYEQVLHYQNKGLSERMRLWGYYYDNLVEENKLFSDLRPKVIIPNKNGEEGNPFFEDKV